MRTDAARSGATRQGDRLLLGTVCVALCALLNSGVLLAGAEQAAFDSLEQPRVRQDLDRLLRDLTARELFSGVVLVAKRDRLLFEGAYGLASREYSVPNTLDTKFNLASANKMLTAVAIAQLAESGKLRFDDPIGRYLGEDWIAPEIGRKVRIEQLLSHTSGLTDYFNDTFEGSSRRLFKRIDDYKVLVRDSELLFEPGTRWSYCNTGFLLLGVIVEKVSGASYFEYVRTNITDPLGMRDTTALDLEDVNTKYAQGYAKLGDGATDSARHPAAQPGVSPRRPPLREMARATNQRMEQLAQQGYRFRNNVFMHVAKGGPAGGYYSTVRDLLRFIEGFSDGRLVSKKTIELMSTPKPAAPHWGYGMSVEDGVVGHGGGFPGIGSLALMYPGGYRLVLLSNVDGGTYVAFHRMLELLESAAGAESATPSGR